MIEPCSTSFSELGIKLPIDPLGLKDVPLFITRFPYQDGMRFMCAANRAFDRVDIDYIGRFVTPENTQGLPRPTSPEEARFYPPTDSFSQKGYKRGDAKIYPYILWDRKDSVRILRSSHEIPEGRFIRNMNANLGLLVAAYCSPPLLDYWNNGLAVENKLRWNRIDGVPIPVWTSLEEPLRELVVYTPLLEKLEATLESQVAA